MGLIVLNDRPGLAGLLCPRSRRLRPPADVSAVHVEAPSLQHGVEDPEIRSGIGTEACRPLPSEGVVGQIRIHQAIPEPGRSVLPGDDPWSETTPPPCEPGSQGGSVISLVAAAGQDPVSGVGRGGSGSGSDRQQRHGFFRPPGHRHERRPQFRQRSRQATERASRPPALGLAGRPRVATFPVGGIHGHCRCPLARGIQHRRVVRYPQVASEPDDDRPVAHALHSRRLPLSSFTCKLPPN